MSEEVADSTVRALAFLLFATDGAYSEGFPARFCGSLDYRPGHGPSRQGDGNVDVTGQFGTVDEAVVVGIFGDHDCRRSWCSGVAGNITESGKQTPG